MLNNQSLLELKTLEHLLKCMKIIGDDTIQRTQLTHRIELVKTFQVKKGMKVLEIGCGQGDTTVVLADAVGETGQIVAIDIASPEYGAPITLGEAAETISQSPLGQRIDFHFETDFLQMAFDEKFDVIVLSHCSWYFESIELLKNYLQKSSKSLTGSVLLSGTSIIHWSPSVPIFAQPILRCFIQLLQKMMGISRISFIKRK